jgi:hypothetical protein
LGDLGDGRVRWGLRASEALVQGLEARDEAVFLLVDPVVVAVQMRGSESLDRLDFPHRVLADELENGVERVREGLIAETRARLALVSRGVGE